MLRELISVWMFIVFFVICVFFFVVGEVGFWYGDFVVDLELLLVKLLKIDLRFMCFRSGSCLVVFFGGVGNW